MIVTDLANKKYPYPTKVTDAFKISEIASRKGISALRFCIVILGVHECKATTMNHANMYIGKCNEFT